METDLQPAVHVLDGTYLVSPISQSLGMGSLKLVPMHLFEALTIESGPFKIEFLNVLFGILDWILHLLLSV